MKRTLWMLWVLLLGCGPALEITNDSLPDGTVGAPWSMSVQYVGRGDQMGARDLPPGLHVPHPDWGGVSGTPTEAGDYTPTLLIWNDRGERDEKTLPMKIYPALSFTTQSLPAGRVGVPYSATLQAQGGKPLLVYGFNISPPSGMGLDRHTGDIYGTPSISGSFQQEYTVTDNNWAVAKLTLTLEIAP